jgi:uncharacterized protein (TIGR02145 family)
MKTKILVLSAALLLSANLRAQVTIGSLNTPAAGAILDLNNGAQGGLVLSNVELVNLWSIPATGFTGITDVQDSKPDLAGMLVYHTGVNDIPAGIYLWNGENWTPIGQDCRELSAITIYAPEQLILGNKNITLSATTANSHCSAEEYKWYRTNGTSETYETTPFATTGPELTLALSDFPRSPAVYKVKVEVNSPYSPAPIESEVFIAVGGCPAKISADPYPSGWLTFQCHNLGGVDITSDADLANITPQNFRTYHGDWYRWGSLDVSMENTVAHNSNNTWDNSDYQESAEDDTSQKDADGNNLWKAANNPCPAGWRLPTQAEWQAVIDNNTIMKYTGTSGEPSKSWTENSNDEVPSANYNNVMKVGDHLYLPAAGLRHVTTGQVGWRGRDGYYWSSSVNVYSSNHATSMGFNGGGQSVTYSLRAYGFSVRCVSAN